MAKAHEAWVSEILGGISRGGQRCAGRPAGIDSGIDASARRRAPTHDMARTITLSSTRVRLEPLDHAPRGRPDRGRPGRRAWRLWYTTHSARPRRWAPRSTGGCGLQAAGSMLPFAVIELPRRDKAVGMTTYMNVDAANRRVEIGSTWYRRSVQRTDLNTQCKLLLLTHAFERLDCIAVEFRTHFFNHRAGAASSGWAPSSTASCAATSGAPTARCATPASTASSPASGRR